MFSLLKKFAGAGLALGLLAGCTTTDKSLQFNASGIDFNNSSLADAPVADAYDRAANPQYWNRFGVPQPRNLAYGGAEPAGSILIDHSTQHLYLVLGGGQVREYVIGVGKSESLRLPAGGYYVSSKEIDPYWVDPSGNQARNPFSVRGPASPLGVRGMRLIRSGTTTDQGFMIHGTNQPQLLGSNARFISHGCIRLHNEDVLDLFPRVQYNARVYSYYGNEVRQYLGRRTAQADNTPLNPA